MRKFSVGLFALAVAFTGPAHAAPSFLRGGSTSPNFVGATGILLTPSAYTVGDRGFSAHAYANPRFGSYGVLVGPVDRLEVGATFLDKDDCNCNSGGDFLLNAKLNLLKESRVLPAFSVGVVDALDELDLDPSWYAVLSKDFARLLPLKGISLKGSVGYGGGLYENDPFASVEVGLGSLPTPLVRPSVSGLAEYTAGDVNVGLRARYRGFAATVGLFDFSRVGGGISYTAGLRLW
jgi:hypothetical protein